MVVALKGFEAGFENGVRSLLREVGDKADTAGISFPLIDSFWRHGLSLLFLRGFNGIGCRHHCAASQGKFGQAGQRSRLTQEGRQWGRASERPLASQSLIHVFGGHHGRSSGTSQGTSQYSFLVKIRSQRRRRWLDEFRGKAGGSREELARGKRGGASRQRSKAASNAHLGSDCLPVVLGVLQPCTGLIRSC